MAIVLPVSDRYRDAMRFAVVLQVPVAVIIARRPRTPAGWDLVYVRYGYLPLVVVAAVCAAVLGG